MTEVITPWTGAIADIPDGWLLCDGNNGTPDMIDKFVRGVPNGTTTPGSTGGSHQQTVTESDLPQHTHTLSVNSVGSHTHQVKLRENNFVTAPSATLYDAHESGSGGSTGTDNIGSGGSHAHTASADTTGSDGSFDNRPSFYEVAFIKRNE